MIENKELLVKPVIHLNGSSAESLREDYVAAYHAVIKASEALSNCGPNGRDYYPVPGSLSVAVHQHVERQNALGRISEELMDLATHCDGFAKISLI